MTEKEKNENSSGDSSGNSEIKKTDPAGSKPVLPLTGEPGNSLPDKPTRPYYGGAPPKKLIDYRIFEELCKINCTEEEISAILNISISTLQERIKEHYFDEETGEPCTFKDVYKRYSNYGIASLRREQFRSAIHRKNTVMQVWLGKQYLGQRDKFDATSGGAGIRPVQIFVDSQETANKLSSLSTKIMQEKTDTMNAAAGTNGTPVPPAEQPGAPAP